MKQSEETTAGAIGQSMEDEYKKRLDRIEDFCKQVQSEWHKYLALQSTDIIMRQIIGMTKGAYNETNTMEGKGMTKRVDKIDSLKQFVSYLRKKEDSFSPDFDKLDALIDAEIARQSVTDEAVQRAIEWAEQERKNSFRYMDFGDADSASLSITALQSYQPTTRKNRTVEEAAISKTETTSNSCWYCKGIELHNIKSVKTVTDESDRELGAYDTPYNYCPNCGRKLVK